jgi:hypothetical protein
MSIDKSAWSYEEGNPSNESEETQRTELEEALQDAWKEKLKRHDLELKIDVALKDIGKLILWQEVAGDEHRNQYLLGRLEFLKNTLKG